MQIIHYEPQEVWDIFDADLASAEILIAENPETGVEIFVTHQDKDPMRPSIRVLIDNALLYAEDCISQNDCTQTVRKFYYEYLDPGRLIDHLEFGCDDEDDEDLYSQHMKDLEIEEREDDLNMLFDDFLEDVLSVPLSDLVDDPDKVRDDVKEHMLEYLYRKWGVSVYRPMWLEEDDGTEFFEEHPYGCMVFKDPYNPIYKS